MVRRSATAALNLGGLMSLEISATDQRQDDGVHRVTPTQLRSRLSSLLPVLLL